MNIPPRLEEAKKNLSAESMSRLKPEKEILLLDYIDLSIWKFKLIEGRVKNLEVHLSDEHYMQLD